MNNDKNEDSLEKTISNNKVPDDLTVTDLDVRNIESQTSLDKAFTELYSQVNLEKKTEFLKNNEIKKLGTLYTMAKHYGFIALQERIIKHMEMRISLKRKGRNEMVQIVQAERQQEAIRNGLDSYTRREE